MHGDDAVLLELAQLIGVEVVAAGVAAAEEEQEGPIGTPWSFSAARSCRKPRNGAIPVPAPTMIIGVCGLSGGRNGIDGSRTNTNAVPCSGRAARYVEHTPRNSPTPPRAGAASTPEVRLQTSELTSGDDEIE